MATLNLPYLQRLILYGTFLNYSLNFVFPLLATLLVTSGSFEVRQSALLIAAAHFVSAIVQPVIGRWIDRDRFYSPVLIAIIGNILGVLGLFSDNAMIVFASISMFLLSSGALNILQTHVIEGLAVAQTRRAQTLKTHLIANVGFAIAGGIWYFYGERYRALLLFLDVASTMAICGIFFYSGRNLTHAGQPSERLKQSPLPLSDPTSSVAFKTFEVVTIAFVLNLAMSAIFTALQFLYRDLGLDTTRYSSFVLAVASLTVALTILFQSKIKVSLGFRCFLGAATLAIGLTLQPLINSLLICGLLTVLWSVGETFVIGELSPLFFSLERGSNLGSISALKNFSSKLAHVICPLIILLFEPKTVFSYGFIFGLPTLVAGFLMYRILAQLRFPTLFQKSFSAHPDLEGKR